MGKAAQQPTTTAAQAIILSLALISTASAFCTEPAPPMFKPEKPSAPYCVDTYTNTHDCDEYVIDSYYADLEDYNYDVEFYIRDLQAYVEDAVEYAECEINSLQ